MAAQMIHGRLVVRGDKGTIANVYKMQKEVVAEIRHATIKAGNDIHSLAFQLCPKDTWLMARSLKIWLSKKQRAVEVYWDPEDFKAEGEPFYPPFVEFGTSLSAAQPSLGPAFDIMAPYYKADVSRAIKNGLRKAAQGGDRRPA